MSLRHALLAVLTAEPMTGYDLVKYFDGSVVFVWNAPHSQIYPELRRMCNEGLLDVEEIPRGERATKKRYSINEEGLRELRKWAERTQTLQPERDPYRLRAAYFEWSTFESARRQLQEHLNHYLVYQKQWESMLADLESNRVPLLKRRLETRPPSEHEAISAFKRFAFNGEISRARMEITWAEEGLRLLDDLERRKVKLASDRYPIEETSEKVL